MKEQIFTFMVGCFILVTNLCCSNFETLSDNELEEVSAQGFHMNFQILDNLVNNANNFNNINNPTPIVQVPQTINSENFNLIDSMLIKGQENAFVPINAIDSAVNVPINIVFVMNSKITGGVNISNVLNSALNPLK